MEPYYEPGSEFREPLTDVDAFLDCARYNEDGDLALLQSYLEKNPGDVDARDEQGRTAVHMAAANGHMPILEMLFRFHPEPNAVNDEGNTALHFAALNNRVAAAEALLERGWRPAEQNVMGKTALQLIYEKQYNEMEALLIGRDESLDTYVPPNQAYVSVDLPADDAGEPEGNPHDEPSAQADAKATPTHESAPAATAPAPQTPAPAAKEPVKDATTGSEMLGAASVDGIE
ncbi:Ankyrin repeats (many copies)/Ankyrin repeats (3 copies)/Ankyrin repeat [Novymonas esmeraldas]|uniref:Ankyrin repeats (Many copies)/Ankyrin repeats (3 copies)/Ankyrin repeat n=1 Tax=Novymonas esmeraldas TaxID=1808958 RepID=A0AAW0F5Q7_9TRYP